MGKLLLLADEILRSFCRLTLDIGIVFMYGSISAIFTGIKCVLSNFDNYFKLSCSVSEKQDLELKREETQKFVFGELIKHILMKCDTRELLTARLIAKSWSRIATRILQGNATKLNTQRLGLCFNFSASSGTFHLVSTFKHEHYNTRKTKKEDSLKIFNAFLQNTPSFSILNEEKNEFSTSFPALSFTFEGLTRDSLNTEEFLNFARVFGAYLQELSLNFKEWQYENEIRRVVDTSSQSQKVIHILTKLPSQFPRMEILEIQIFPGWPVVDLPGNDGEGQENQEPEINLISRTQLHHLHTIKLGWNRPALQPPQQAVIDETRDFFQWTRESCPNIRLIKVFYLRSLAVLPFLPFPNQDSAQTGVESRSTIRIQILNLHLCIFEDPIDLLEELVKGKFSDSHFYKDIWNLTITVHLTRLSPDFYGTGRRRIQILVQILEQSKGTVRYLECRGSALSVLARILPFPLPKVKSVETTDYDNRRTYTPPIDLDSFFAAHNIVTPKLEAGSEFKFGQLFPSLADIFPCSTTVEYYNEFLHLFRHGPVNHIENAEIAALHLDPHSFSGLQSCFPLVKKLHIMGIQDLLLAAPNLWGFERVKILQLRVSQYRYVANGNFLAHFNFYPDLDAALSGLDPEAVELLTERMAIIMQEERESEEVQILMDKIEEEVEQARRYSSILDLKALEKLVIHFVGPYRWDEKSLEVPIVLSELTERFTLQKMTTFPTFRLQISLNGAKVTTNEREIWEKSLAPLKLFSSVEVNWNYPRDI